MRKVRRFVTPKEMAVERDPDQRVMVLWVTLPRLLLGAGSL